MKQILTVIETGNGEMGGKAIKPQEHRCRGAEPKKNASILPPQTMVRWKKKGMSFKKNETKDALPRLMEESRIKGSDVQFALFFDDSK